MHIDWSSLQTVEALVRLGTVQGAAQALGLRHSSVSRRVDALERSLGVPLFTRGARLVPTAVALDISARAAHMLQHAQSVEALVAGQHRAREGRVVVTTSDVLAPLLFSAIAGLEAHRFEVLVGDDVSALAPGVIDMALRPSHDPGSSLQGRRLGALRLGVYRTRGGASTWVQPSPSLRAKASMRWWRVVPEDEGRVVCNSLLAMRDACLAGLGKAVLPSFLARGQPRLKLERELTEGTPVWLLSPSVRGGDAALRRLRERLATELKRYGAFVSNTTTRAADEKNST